MCYKISYFGVDGTLNQAKCSLHGLEIVNINLSFNCDNPASQVILRTFQCLDKWHYKILGRRTTFEINYLDPEPLRQNIVIDPGKGDALLKVINQLMTYIQRAKHEKHKPLR